MTKTAAARRDRIDLQERACIEAAWRLSLQRLGRDRVHALLVHHADDLLVPGGHDLYAWLRALRDTGEVTLIGVSVYDAQQIEALFARYGGAARPFDIVQLPASIADQRMLEGATLPRLHAQGVQIHVRSLYLQGLLLAAPDFVEQRFPGKGAWLGRLHAFCAERGLSPVQACMSFLRSSPLFDIAVVGATSAGELREMVHGLESAPVLDWQEWAENDPQWVDPRRWSRA